MAYTILLLHVLLLAGLGVLVLFFGGVMRYMFWIFIVGMAVVTVSAYLFYRRLRRQGQTLRDTLRSPMFGGRAVEISLLGGMAAIRLGAPEHDTPHATLEHGPTARLEDPETARIRDIAALAELLERDLITPEEFAVAKQKLFNN